MTRLISSVLLGLIVGLALLTLPLGRSDVVDIANIQDNAAVPAGALTPASTIGQTFVSHSARLSALQVRWIVSGDFQAAPSGRVTLHLCRGPADSTDLAAASIPLGEIHNNEYTAFHFAPLPDSQSRAYYFFLDASTAEITHGYVTLWASAGDDYPDGALYVNGVAGDRDLVWRAYHTPDLAALIQSLADAWGRFGRAVLVALGMLYAVGLLLVLARKDARPDWDAVLLAGGIGLAAASGLSLVLLVLPLPGAPVLAVVAGLLVILAATRWAILRRATRRQSAGDAPDSLRPYVIALGILALVSLAADLIQIDDLSVPLWIDSYSHAFSIRNVIEHGQLPAVTFYHLGYHVATALLCQLAGLSIPEAMLLMGPLLIAQTGVAVFVLSRRLSGSALAGLVAAVAVWFLSPTPAYFVTWGRYPLLLGGVLLPLALFYAIEWIDEPRPDARTLLLAALTFGGLACAQMRLTVVYAVLTLMYAALLSRRMRLRRRLVRIAPVAAAGGCLFVVLFLLWFVRGVSLQSMLAENMAAPVIDLATAISVARSHDGMLVAALAALGIIVGLLRRRRLVAVVVGWYVALFLFALIPYSTVTGRLISPDLVILTAYLPAALVIGDAVQAVAAVLAAWSRSTASGRDVPPERLYTGQGTGRIGDGALDELRSQPPPREPRLDTGMRRAWLETGAGVVLAVVAVLGARELLSIVNPATVLYTGADERAMTFIRQQTAPDSVFLVNSFQWYASTWVPSDGGAWIPYETGRPVAPLDADMVRGEQAPEALPSWIAARGVGYVYLGRRAGALARADFACRPDRYALVYRQEGIDIFRVERPGEPQDSTALPQEDCGSGG